MITLAAIPIKASGNSSKKFKLYFRCTSKISSDSFETVEDFWNHHSDPVASKLNKVFLSKGWLIKCDSKIGEDKKSVEVVKIYKNKACFEAYEKLWHYGSGIFTKEQKLVNYVSIQCSEKNNICKTLG